MISAEDKQRILDLISEACAAGARRVEAAKLLGLTIRSLQRWKKNGLSDQRKGPHSPPANKLSAKERDRIVTVLKTPEYADLNPNQIVPKLADQGIYIASESTIYRILRSMKMDAHRNASHPPKKRSKSTLLANSPNQIWSWDITYLPTNIRGKYYYLYMIMDLYSRKAVACQVFEAESGEHASDLIVDACHRENIPKDQVVLHSDNGSPMKSFTMLSKLHELGITPSFNRPGVSNDNPFSESLFKTMKYRPEYPEKPFGSLFEAREWSNRFIRWYNDEHLHSALNFVTPNDRHCGKDAEILANRDQVYQEARLKNPNRWSGNTRNWKPAPAIELKQYRPLNNPGVKAA